MAAIQVSINRQNAVLQVLARNLPEEIIPEFVDKLADACLTNIYSRAPWRSGFLAMSVTKKVEGNTAEVGPTASYASFVSLGTRPHEIRPRNGRVLAFPIGNFGGLVFATRVQHPGIRPNPYLHLAAEDTLDQALDLFNGVWMNYMGL